MRASVGFTVIFWLSAAIYHFAVVPSLGLLVCIILGAISLASAIVAWCSVRISRGKPGGRA